MAKYAESNSKKKNLGWYSSFTNFIKKNMKGDINFIYNLN